MTEKKAKKAVDTTQSTVMKQFPEASQVASLLDIQNDSISDLSETELVSLLKELKISLKAIARIQRALGSLQHAAGQSLKIARQQRVMVKPETRKVMLTQSEYDRFKEYELNSSPQIDVETEA